MALKLITPATALAVTLDDVKAHLRVDTSDDDAIVTAYLRAATEMAEQATGRAIMLQTWELTLDAFPSALKITRVPVVSITSVSYTDTSGSFKTVNPYGYVLDNADDYGLAFVVPAYASGWPDTRDQINAVAVRYVSGYADAASVPEGIKAWIKLMVGAMYENREAETVGAGGPIKMGFADRLLDRYVVWAL